MTPLTPLGEDAISVVGTGNGYGDGNGTGYGSGW